MADKLYQTDIDDALREVAKTQKPRDLRFDNREGVGTLMLRVRPSARHGALATWVRRYRLGGSDRDDKIGRYERDGAFDGVSFDRAKRKFSMLCGDVQDRALNVERSAPELNRLVARDMARPTQKDETVGALVGVFLEQYVRLHNKENRYRSLKCMFAAHLGRIAGLRADELTGRQLNEVIHEIAVKRKRPGTKQLAGGLTQADRFRSVMIQIYNMALLARTGKQGHKVPSALGDFNISKTTVADFIDLKRDKKAYEPRNKAIDPVLLPRIYAELHAGEGIGCLARDTTKHLHTVLRLALLLGATRVEQIAALTPAEIDLTENYIYLKDEKARHDRPARSYRLPLQGESKKQAVALVALLKSGSQLTPQSTSTGMVTVLRRVGLRKEGSLRKQPRDIRSSVTVWLLSEKWGNAGLIVSNLIQSHDMGTMVMKHYASGYYFEDEIRDVLLKLENHLLGRAELKQAA